MSLKKTRVFGREILKTIYNEGLDAVALFVRHYGTLQDADVARALTPPISDMWVERAAWGELATKYVYWAEYIHNNEFLTTPNEMQVAIRNIFRLIDLKDQAEKAWEITGRQVLYGELEAASVKKTRFTVELADLMAADTRITEKVQKGFFSIVDSVC